jgi:hypothetical protein
MLLPEIIYAPTSWFDASTLTSLNEKKIKKGHLI